MRDLESHQSGRADGLDTGTPFADATGMMMPLNRRTGKAIVSGQCVVPHRALVEDVPCGREPLFHVQHGAVQIFLW